MFKNSLLIFLALLLCSGCVSAGRKERRIKTQGWEFVRIEKQLPSKDCIYKMQEVCGEKSLSQCYIWYKQRAKFYGANTVVITEDEKSRTAVFGSPNPVSPAFKSSMTAYLLADFYDCPKCEPIKEQK